MAKGNRRRMDDGRPQVVNLSTTSIKVDGKLDGSSNRAMRQETLGREKGGGTISPIEINDHLLCVSGG